MYNEPETDESRFDSPGGPEDAFDLEGPTAVDKAKDFALDAGSLLKKHGLKIIIIILLLGGGYFVYDFFIGSVKQVSFSVVDTEGAHVSGSGVKIFDSTGAEIQKIAGGQTTDLKTGNYTASVTANGYKQKIGVSVTVIENPTLIVVEIEKDWTIELTVDDFPQTLVEGQNTGFFVTIKNEKSEEKIELVFEGSLDSKYMTTKYPSPIVAPLGETRVFVEINVKENLKSSLIKEGLKGTVRIKELNNSKAKKTVSFNMAQFERNDLRVTGSTRFGIITEGNTGGPKDITIENRLDYPVENISFEVDIKNTPYSNPNEVEQWFSFDRDVPIDILPAGDKIKIGLMVQVPIGIPFESGNDTETISGKLFIRTDFWEEEVDIDLTAKKSKVELLIQGLRSQSVRFDSTTGGYPAKAGIITLKNNGELPLQTVNLSSICNTSGNWIASNIVTFSKTFFDEIPAKGNKETTYTIKIPNPANNGDIVECGIVVNYNDPRDTDSGDGTDRLGTEQALLINVG